MELIRQYPRAAVAFFTALGGAGGGIIKGFHDKLNRMESNQIQLLEIFRQFQLENNKSFEEFRRENLKYHEEIRRESLEKFSELTIDLYKSAFSQNTTSVEVLRKLEPEEISQIIQALKDAFEQLHKNPGAKENAGDAEDDVYNV